MHLILTTIILMALLRWAAARYLRSKGHAGLEALREGASPSGAGDLSMWQALRQELWAWLVVAGVLGVLFLLAVIYVYFFGSFRPIHEW
jgi:hypothetical protein